MGRALGFELERGRGTLSIANFVRPTFPIRMPGSINQSAGKGIFVRSRLVFLSGILIRIGATVPHERGEPGVGGKLRGPQFPA